MSKIPVGREMPKYKCFKEIWALKIKKIVRNNEGILNAENDGTAIITALCQLG